MLETLACLKITVCVCAGGISNYNCWVKFISLKTLASIHTFGFFGLCYHKLPPLWKYNYKGQWSFKDIVRIGNAVPVTLYAKVTKELLILFLSIFNNVISVSSVKCQVTRFSKNLKIFKLLKFSKNLKIFIKNCHHELSSWIVIMNCHHELSSWTVIMSCHILGLFAVLYRTKMGQNFSQIEAVRLGHCGYSRY